MKHKILYVNLFPEIGGAETSLLYLLQKLNKKIFAPYVIVPQQGYFSERLKKLNVKVIFLDLPGFLIRELFIPGVDPLTIFKFYKLCKRLKPDLIHLTHITQAGYAGILSKLFKIPVIALSWMNSDTVYFYQDLIYQFSCTKILAVTPKLAKRLTRRGIIAKDKVEIAIPGLDVNFFKPTQSKPKKFLTITIASRFDPTKDHLTFFRAMKIVCKEFPSIRVLITQDPKVNLEEKNTLAKTVMKNINNYLDNNPGLAQKVVFTGYQNDMRKIYSQTDILVSSSLYESLGMIHMEAAASGVPIVSTNFDGQHLIVKNAKTGFLVPIHNPSALARKIVILAKNKDLRYKFGVAARNNIVENFDIERYKRKLERVYLKCLKM